MAHYYHWLSLALNRATFVALCFIVTNSTVQAAPFAYITNQGDHTVSIVDLNTLQSVNKLAVGQAPVGVAIDHFSQRLFVSNVESRSISVIDIAKPTVLGEVKLGFTPVGLQLSKDGSLLFVADWFADRIFVYRQATLMKALANNQPAEVEKEILLGRAPAGMAISREGASLYVTLRDSNNVGVIDVRTLTPIHTIPVGQHPFGISLSNDGRTMVVVNVESNSISLIDTHQDKVTDTIRVGEHPYCVTSNADGSRLFVSNTGEDTVSVIEMAQKKQIQKIAVGGFPEGMAYDTQHQQVISASWMDNSITVIDAQSLSVKKQVPTGAQSRAFGAFIANPVH